MAESRTRAPARYAKGVTATTNQVELDMQPTGCILFHEMDAVFKALADESRRKLLDQLYKSNGQPLGESGRRHLARAREAALPQSSAVARDLRALDWQIRTPSPSSVERFEKGSRRKQKQER